VLLCIWLLTWCATGDEALAQPVGPADAQQRALGFERPVRAGDCSLVVRLGPDDLWDTLLGRESEFDLFEALEIRRLQPGPERVDIELEAPIRPFMVVQALVRRGGRQEILATEHIREPVSEWPANASCDVPPSADPRPRVLAHVETGWFVDSFAGLLKFENDVGGVEEFSISQASGRPMVAPTLSFALGRWDWNRGGGIWGEAHLLYGVKQVPCGDLIDPTSDPRCEKAVPQANRIQELLAEATSAEMYWTIRGEHFTLNRYSDWPVRPYLAFTYGSVFVLNSLDGKARNRHRLVMGLRTIGGKFRDSYVEGGQARNELLTEDNGDSFTGVTFAAAIVYAPGGIADKIGWLNRIWPSTRVFVRASLDRRKGRDSLDTSFGISYDFSSVAGGFVPRGVRP
jgi:hypothetical protein